VKHINDIDKLFEGNQGYPHKDIPKDYLRDLDDKLDAEQIDKLFAGNQGYPHVENIPNDYLNNLDNMLERAEVDDLFRGNQGYPDVKEIPTDYLNDLDKRLDVNTAKPATGALFSSSFSQLLVLGIASVLLYFVFEDHIKTIFTEEKTALVNNENPEDISEWSKNNLTQTNKKEETNTSEQNTLSSSQVTNTPNHGDMKRSSPSHIAIVDSTASNSWSKNAPIKEKENYSKETAPSSTVHNKTPKQSTSSKNTVQTNTINAKRVDENNKALVVGSKQQQSNADNRIVPNSNTSVTITKKDATIASKSIAKNNTSADKSNSKISSNKEKAALSEQQSNNTDKSINGIQQNISNTITTEYTNTKQSLNTGTEKTNTNSPNALKDSAVSKVAENPSNAVSKTDSLIIPKQIALTKTDSIVDSVAVKPVDTVAAMAKDTAGNKKSDISDTKNKGIKTLQLNAGLLKVQSNFLSPNSNYEAKRKNEESAIVVVDATLLVNYSIYNFIFSSGVNYGQWGEKVNYNSVIDSVDYFVKYDTTRSVIIENDNSVLVNTTLQSVMGKKAEENTGITQKNGVNRYSYINIPVLIGYVIGKNNFTVTPKIGALVGVPLKNKGYYINSDLNQLVEETPMSWIFNYQAELEFKYRNFIFSPYYRRNASIVIESSNTHNSYYGFGFQFGYVMMIH
jgi:hypothetical protein